MDKLTYLWSSVSSTENDINTQLSKAYTAIGSLSVIWKLDITNKLNRIFPSSGCLYATMWMP